MDQVSEVVVGSTGRLCRIRRKWYDLRLRYGWSDDLEKELRSSEKQKPCACVTHTLYVGIEGFIRATAAQTS